MYNSLKFLSSHKQMVDWQNAHLFLAHKNFATKYLISGVSRLHSIKTRFHLKHVDIFWMEIILRTFEEFFCLFQIFVDFAWDRVLSRFYLKGFPELMSLSIDALTSALLGCHQSAHCAPAVSGWRRLTERRRRRLVTSVKVSFLYPPVSTTTTATDSPL